MNDAEPQARQDETEQAPPAESAEAPQSELSEAQILDPALAPFDALLSAIPGDQPCGDGANARYEDAFDVLEAQIRKLSAVSATTPVDWTLVRETSQTYLTTLAKDIMVAAYFSHALFVKNGYQGLMAAVMFMEKFVSQFWDGLYPAKKRLSGRAAALTWWLERMDRRCGKVNPNVREMRYCGRIVELLDGLEGNLGPLFEGFDSNEETDFEGVIFQVKRKLQSHASSFEQKQKQIANQRHAREAGEAGDAAQDTASTGEGEKIPTDVNTDDDIERILEVFTTAMENISNYYRDKNLNDPMGFLFTRHAAWLQILELPADQDGKTQIPGPRPERITYFEKAVEQGDYKEIVTELEEEFFNNCFWITSQRILCEALERLGPAYQPCAQVVRDQLAVFVRRFPRVLDLQFTSGIPFADDKTREWVDSEVFGGFGSGGGGVALGGEENAPWLDVAAQAKTKASEGDFAAGLVLFREGQRQATSKRENFVWRIYQSSYSLDAGQLELAIGQLESLDNQAQALGLDEWEPQLSVEVARLLLLCYSKYLKKTQKTDSELEDKMEDLYRRICRLDINTALTIEDKPWQA